jgi:signal peptidase I
VTEWVGASTWLANREQADEHAGVAHRRAGKHMIPVENRRKWSRLVLAFGLFVVADCGTTRINIAGNAMAPTLKMGDKALATRTFTDLARTDVVGLRYPEDESKSFVERIIGLPGERIAMREGYVFINDKPLDEPYVLETNRSKDSWGPMTVETGNYFVMGDNRKNSSDSRSWGLVRRDAIWAKVIIQ